MGQDGQQFTRAVPVLVQHTYVTKGQATGDRPRMQPTTPRRDLDLGVFEMGSLQAVVFQHSDQREPDDSI